MSTVRITPIDPPYPAEIQAEFDKIMRGAPPLLLFRTVARNPRVLQRFFAGSLLVSFMANAFGVQAEESSPRFPHVG